MAALGQVARLPGASTSLATMSSQQLHMVLLFVSPLWESLQLTNPAKTPKAVGRFPLSW